MLRNLWKKVIQGEKKDEFFTHVKTYYQSVCNYLQDILPHDDLFLKKVSVISPQNFIQSGAIDNLKGLMATWPIIIPNGSSQDDVINQLNSLQIELIEKETLPSACEDVC